MLGINVVALSVTRVYQSMCYAYCWDNIIADITLVYLEWLLMAKALVTPKQEIQYNFKYSIIQNMIKNIDICKQKKQTDKFWEN